MPRDKLTIEAFNKGIACGLDREDVTPEASVYSEDVDVLTPEGTLRGRMGDATAYADQVDEAAFLVNGTTWDLIFREGSDLKAVKDFYGAKTVVTLSLPAGAVVTAGLTFARRGKALYVGCGPDYAPLRVGYTPWDHFGVDDDGTLRCLYAMCLAAGPAVDWVISNIAEGAGTGYFKTSKVYFWKYCLIYNGYERGPLSASNVGGHSHNPTEELAYTDVTIRLTGDIAALPKNVTGLELYRAEMDLAGATSSEPVEYYSLVASLDLTVATQSANASGEPWYYQSSGGNALFRYRDRGDAGVTYEAQSGIPEALNENYVTYGLSAEALGYLFVGNCSRLGAPDAAMMIFRSKPYRFSMFNWAEEYLILPFAPVAMASWNGKLYVFGSAECARIDPSTFTIEDTLPGVGARGKQSVLSTEAGVFVFGKENVYLISSSGVVPVGNAIRTAQTSSLYTPVTVDTLGASFAPRLAWDARGGLLLAVVHRTGTTYGMLVYDVKGSRWEYWTLTGSGGCALSGKNGEVYVGTNTELVLVGGGSTRRSATWISPVLLFGRVGTKKVYKLKLSGTGTVSYAVDGDTAWRALTGDSLDDDHWLCTRLQLKCALSSTQEARALEVVYRHLEGVR